MIQPSCVNWGQIGCHYFNTRDYDWEDGLTIYLVKERYQDEEHTQFEYVNVYYYLCEEDYLNIISLNPTFFSDVEKIVYHQGMSLDENKKFKSTAKRFLRLREQKKVIDQNLKTLRFNRDDLVLQLHFLQGISDEDFARLYREFNDDPIHQGVLKASEISREKRIEILKVVIEKISG